jgi:hypothetical protein
MTQIQEIIFLLRCGLGSEDIAVKTCIRLERVQLEIATLRSLGKLEVICRASSAS